MLAIGRTGDAAVDTDATAEFETRTETGSSSKSREVDGYFMVNEILKMNSFDGNSMEASDAKDLAMQLIAMSEKDYEYTSDVVEHESLPLLNRYKYIKGLGLHRETGSSSVEVTRDKFKGSGGKAQKALEEASGESGVAQLKVENPKFLEFKNKVTVVRSGKSMLEKLHTQTKDLVAKLNSKLSDPTIAAAMPGITSAMKKGDEFINELRSELVAFDDVDGSQVFGEMGGVGGG